jgi:hypothetical protein
VSLLVELNALFTGTTTAATWTPASTVDRVDRVPVGASMARRVDEGDALAVDG